jgi:prophage regulatory protein|tara:strand:- start:748 stop:987 length:240 start_codon:yes stop_codon:yes gene_type:complete
MFSFGGMTMNKVLSVRQITAATGLSPVTIWRKEKKGEFPARRQLGPRRVGWLTREVDEWLESTPKSEITSPKNGHLKNE